MIKWSIFSYQRRAIYPCSLCSPKKNRLLSALTIPGPIKSSAKDLSRAIFEIAIDHLAYSGGGGSYEVGPKPISFHVIMHAVGQPCLASMDSGLEAFSRNPTDGSFAVLTFQLAAFTKYLNEVFLSY